ncbi:hypothetical protein NHQ30_003857 [Ciborinia camelliae]|nr:hypothetical protein NHQ30_003857 [Ciborinia camelliae]
MSFGWSAGDIAQAISLIIKVVKALDDGSGAPDDYRKAAIFLENVNHTLKNLHFFTTLGTYPSYGDEIRRQVENIRPPLEGFLDFMNKFESDLGSKAAPGWWRNISKKMLWTFQQSHHKLKKEIKEHLLMLNNLLHRFTLETVLTLPDELRQLFVNGLTPQMVSVLEGLLNPIRGDVLVVQSEGREHHKELCSKMEDIILLLQSREIDMSKPESNAALNAAVYSIKEHLTSTLSIRSNDAQTPIAVNYSTLIQEVDTFLPLANNRILRMENTDPLEISDEEIKHSLRKMWVLLLQNVPAKFMVFQAFLIQSFSDTPGKIWVEQGSYLLSNRSSKIALTGDTWSQIVKPGCHVEMAMLLDYIGTIERCCPDTSCQGILSNIPGSLWQKWSVKSFRFSRMLADLRSSSCQKEVLTNDPNGKDNKGRNSTQWKPPIDKPRSMGLETKDVIHFARHVYRLHSLPVESSTSRSWGARISGLSSSAMSQTRPSSSSSSSSRRRSTGGMWFWSCCWCRDISGNHRSSGMATTIISCPECMHVRCDSCYAEWVKTRS